MQNRVAPSRKTKSISKICGVALVSACYLSLPANAEEATKTVAAGQPAAGGQPVALSGTVKAHAGLKEMWHGTKLLQRALLDLAEEVERTQWEIGTTPDAFGSIIVPAVAFPNQGLGELMPPRKKWVNYLTKQIGQLMDIVQADLDATVLPDNASKEVTDAMAEMKSLMADAQKHYKELQEVTKGPKLENLAIGKQVLAMSDDVTKIETAQHKLGHVLRK
jgi:hypothetical protein